MVKRLKFLSKKFLIGGVNSPVRAFKNIGIEPIIFKKAIGAKIYDIKNKKYIDLCMSWGAEILGHSNIKIIKNINKKIRAGICYGFTNKYEIELAELIIKGFPSIEKIRFVNSGTEAVMSAIRLARAFTKRNKILKFDGCYHGHSDFLLADAGSGVIEIPKASSAGIPENVINDTISIPFNNIEILEKVVRKNYKDISCVIVEPVPGNMGVILPENGFLNKLREVTEKYNIILIFDEVITGFRFCFGGVQNLFNIKPDITCLGKIIGGGLSIGAFGGKKEIMNLLAPEGPVYQAGTFSGNPLVMSSGLTVLKTLLNNNIYKNLNCKINLIAKELKKKKEIYFSYFGSMFTIFFLNKKPQNYEEVKKCDLEKFKKWYLKMLKDGIFFPPSQFEASFLSNSHNDRDIKTIIEKISKNLRRI